MSARQRGFVGFLGSGALFTLFVYWIVNPDSYPFDYYPTGLGGVLLIVAPGAGAIIGLIELISDQPFYNLKGWQGSDQNHGPTLLIDCPNCHKKGYWNLYESKKQFSLFFVPIIPYESRFRLHCETCSSGIELKGSEVEAALKLNQEAAKVIQRNLNEEPILQIAERSGLLKRAMAIKRKTWNVSEDAKWEKINDDLIEAILKSNTHPQIGIDKVKEILAEGININAKSESGRTVLSIANYYEVPSVIKALLIIAGAKE